MTKSSPSFFLAAAPLFLILFIDSMGLGLVFPLLNALVLDPNANFISTAFSGTQRNLIYGFTISIFMFCWFFGAALLGEISDQIGRKKSLLICLIGALFSYLFSALAVDFHSFTLLLIGRIIAGITAGSQSIAQAAIVDLSEPEHKARNLGFILFFTSLGFVFGPMAGGILSDARIVSWFGFSIPFYFAAFISLINAILLQMLFNETFTGQKALHIRFHYAIEIFFSAFKQDKIRELSIVFLVMIFGWSGIYSFISMFLLHVYHFDSFKNGLFMGLMGIGFGIATGFLINPLTKRFSLIQCSAGGCLIAALATIFIIMTHTEIYLWINVFVIGVSIAVAYSAILTLFSNQVDAESQGWIMGITGAIMAFAFGINSFLIGILANLSPSMPLLIGSICLIITAGLMKRRIKVSSELVSA